MVAWCWWLASVILASWETDQEDNGLRPIEANSLRHPISKTPNTHTQKGLAEMLK
jgi:hypothetical protein